MTPDQFKSDVIALLPRLQRYALSLTRTPADAEDLLQDTCMQAISNWRKYDQSQPLDRWAFTIMRNYWISELRKRKTRQASSQVPIDEAYDLASNDDGDEKLYASQVNGLVSNLPIELSQTLLLVAAEGYSYKEAASALDVPVGTIMSRIHRARKLIGQSLKQGEDRI